MKLEGLCDVFGAGRFPRLGEADHPELESVLAVRSALAEAVVDDEFLANCIGHELRLFRHGRPRYSFEPFFTVPDLGVMLAFGYWPPGVAAPAHEHTAWTVTAVCRNRLDVFTYDRAETYRSRELVSKNCFAAEAGKVGYIYSPSIHAPRNPSEDWALSMHVISPRDGELLGTEPLACLDRGPRVAEAALTHPYLGVLAARQRHSFVHFLSRILMTMTVPEAGRLLRDCHDVACSNTRRMIRRRGWAGLTESRAPHRFRRTHEDLALSVRIEGEMAAVCADSPDGVMDEFVVSSMASEALAFAVGASSFEVDELPGNLSDEERTAVAEMFEESGLFQQVDQ